MQLFNHSVDMKRGRDLQPEQRRGRNGFGLGAAPKDASVCRLLPLEKARQGQGTCPQLKEELDGAARAPRVFHGGAEEGGEAGTQSRCVGLPPGPQHHHHLPPLLLRDFFFSVITFPGRTSLPR